MHARVALGIVKCRLKFSLLQGGFCRTVRHIRWHSFHWSTSEWSRSVPEAPQVLYSESVFLWEAAPRDVVCVCGDALIQSERLSVLTVDERSENAALADEG